jgi:glycerate-2-kinase
MNKNSLLQLLSSSLHNIDPVFLLKTVPQERLKGDAYLFLGKASERFFEGLKEIEPEKKPILGISPQGTSRRWPGHWIQAEHPLPGEGSFRAGRELLEFFDSLRRLGAKRLTVFLSGGASSLVWLPKAQMKQEALLHELDLLYRAGLDIEELNARRSKLCQLKAGGAARWLKYLAPQVKVRVFLLSDVAPSGAKVVGSGPFWDGKIPHTILADNSSWVKALESEARKREIPILHSSSGQLGTWQSWVQSAIRKVEPTLRANRQGLFIFGGEPSVRLPAKKKGSRSLQTASQKGGRQSHLALALAHHLRPWILEGRVEILAMSSDGSDGNSGAAGVWIDPKKFPKRFALVSENKIQTALRDYQSAALFSKLDALVKPSSHAALSNVQDVLMIRVQ